MPRRPWRFLCLFAALAACKPVVVVGSGVVARVTVDAPVKADCVFVVGTSTTSSVSLESDRVPRAAQLDFAVGEGNGLEGTIVLVARGYVGGCGDAGVLNVESAPHTVTFQEGSADQVVALELKGALDDGDGDGYRSHSAGGPDCDDGDPQVNPGADELCSDGKDNDCNGHLDCADSPRCDGVACVAGATCLPMGHCAAGRCALAAPGCASPPGECYPGPPGCADDGGCRWTSAAGGSCADAGTCRSDGSCAASGIEAVCDNGLDDDHDGLTDCADPDCRGYACDDGDGCTVGDACQADAGCTGPPRSCLSPPGTCFADAGACSGGSCRYAAAPGRACNDNNACTPNDQCRADAGCAGDTPAPCSAADDGGCFAAVGACNPVSGACEFPLRLGGACDDRNPCTAADVCSDAGACAGSAYSCTALPECTTAGSCLGDGGCGYASAAYGAGCDAGACSGTGACVPNRWTFAPSNFDLAAVADAGIAGTLVINCAAVFNSTTMAFTTSCMGQTPVTPRLQPQDGGPDAVLLAVSGLRVSGQLRLEGTRPVIFAVWGDVLIDGGVQVNSARSNPLAGAGALDAAACGKRAGAPGFNTVGVGGGGGGGAFATGGSLGGDLGGGDGGTAIASTRLVPLVGGCPGAQGGGGGGVGGFGGGALQISASGIILVDGTLSASGSGGFHAGTTPNGGGGGGSGGAVLLEAFEVHGGPNSRFTANGGAGGEGAGASGETSADGQDGTLASATAAQGGASVLTGGDGANGAVAGVAATVGGFGLQGGGGGGGGLGRLHVNGYPRCSGSPGEVVSAVLTKNGCN